MCPKEKVAVVPAAGWSVHGDLHMKYGKTRLKVLPLQQKTTTKSFVALICADRVGGEDHKGRGALPERTSLSEPSAYVA